MKIYQKLHQIDDWLTSQVTVTQQPFVGAVLDGVAANATQSVTHNVADNNFGDVTGDAWGAGSTDFVYHEITGYQLSFYTQLNNAGPDSATVADETATNLRKQTVTYLCSEMQDDALVSHGHFLSQRQNSQAKYLFDNGMILQGLCDTYNLNSELIEPINRLTLAICDLQRDDGSFPAAKSTTDVSDSFSADGGCLHIKLAIGLLKAGTIIDSDNPNKAADKLLLWGQQLQQRDGSFTSNPRTKKITTHAFCYALEGYLYAFHKLEKPRYLEIVQNGIDWLINHSDRQGRLTSGGNVHYRGAFGLSSHLQPLLKWRYWDETVQTGRILHILYKLTNNSRYLTQRDLILTSLADSPDGPVVNCTGRFQRNPLGKTFTWPNQFASQLLRFALDDKSASDALEALF